MPLPKRLARLNRKAINPLVRRVAGRLPYFAVVEHAGRRSGRAYRTPVMAYRPPEGFVIALTYGETVDWARNVLAAGSATLEHRGRRIAVTEPRLTEGGDAARAVPMPVRAVLRLLRVGSYLVLHTEPETSQPVHMN